MSTATVAPPWRTATPRLWVVLPAYNEAENLPALLQQIDLALTDEGLPFTVVVVDDGSHDATPEIAAEYSQWLNLRVVTHAVNRGLGETIRDGLRLAAEQSGPRDIVVAMDADNSHSPGLIRRMVGRVREGHDVVIASRYQPGSRIYGVPWHRRLMSDGASWLFRAVFPIPGVRDYTCGFRAYQAELLRRAFAQHGDGLIAATGFNCMIDLLLRLHAMDAVCGEVPMVLRYDLKKGESKMKVGKTIFATLRMLVRRRIGLDS